MNPRSVHPLCHAGWRLALLLLAGATGYAAAPAATAPSAATRPAATRPAAADVAAYRQLVSTLTGPSMEGRGAGTKGIIRARVALARRLKALGLRPAFGRDFIQPLKVSLGVRPVRQQLQILGGGSKTTTARAGEDFNVLGFSASGSVTGEAVFVGYGLTHAAKNYDNFAGAGRAALAGKVAIAYRYEPQDPKGNSLWRGGSGSGKWSSAAALVQKARTVAAHGAGALLIVNPPSQNADTALVSTARSSFGRGVKIPVVHVSLSLLKQMLVRAGEDRPDQAVRKLQQLADADKATPTPLRGLRIRVQTKLRRQRVEVHNVAAVLPGTGKLAGEFVVVGAHYDHIGYGEFGSRLRKYRRTVHPGADDNASGAAGVILLAGQLSRAVASLPTPRRSVLLVCFAGEERGLLGSRYLVDHLDQLGLKVAQIVAMVNLDMIGRVRHERVYALGTESGRGWEAMVRKAAAGTGLKVRTGGAGYGPSDHSSFYRKKVPVLHVISGGHKDLHMPTDTADKINAEGAVRAVTLVAGVVRQLIGEGGRVAYLPPKSGPAGGGAYLGIRSDPVPAGEAGGCPVVAVLSDGPAAMAGMQAGDVIVKFAGKPVADLRSLVGRLARHKPGQTVTVTVRRGEETVELKVTLGKRG